MRRSEEAKRWFSEAEWDLETARILHESRRYNSCAFICQQAAEKSAKALLYSVGESPYGHSVLQLLQRFAEACRKDISDLRSFAAELDRHYIPARYPNAMPSSSPHENYDQEASHRALQYAQGILNYPRVAHTTMTTDLAVKLQPLCKQLRRLFDDPLVLLCGSTALGENMPWSDVDLIVVADFQKPFLERLKELALLDDTGLGLEVLGYTPAEFIQMLDRLNPAAIEAAEFGTPIVSGKFLSTLKHKLGELKKLGLTKTSCSYLLTQRTEHEC